MRLVHHVTNFYDFNFFLRLPKKNDLRTKWCQWIGEIKNVAWQEISKLKYVCICSVHFLSEDRGSGHRLKPGAVPCLLENRYINEVWVIYSEVLCIVIITIYYLIYFSALMSAQEVASTSGSNINRPIKYDDTMYVPFFVGELLRKSSVGYLQCGCVFPNYNYTFLSD